MAKIKVLNEWLHIDTLAEVEPYLSPQAKVFSDKVIDVSPFRTERKPSFFIRLEGTWAGTWGDSGGTDDLRSGNLIKLLAYYFDSTYEDVCTYLLDKYSPKRTSELSIRGAFKPLPTPSEPKDFSYATDLPISKTYLYSRGVRGYRGNNVREDGEKVYYIWRNTKGEVVAVKSREFSRKNFLIEKGDTDMTHHLFNLDEWYTNHSYEWIRITEGEIDAISATWGNALGVATGNGTISNTQIDLLLKTGCQKFVLAMDNDAVGNAFRQKIVKILSKKCVQLFTINLKDCKDYNEYLHKYQLPPEFTKLDMKFV